MTEEHAREISYLNGVSWRGELVMPEGIKIGDKASQVFTRLIELHPEIEAVNLIFYDHLLTSEEGKFVDNLSLWLPAGMVDAKSLKDVSDSSFKASNKQLVMAVGSQLLLREARQFVLIPMMDFAEDCPLGLNELTAMVSSIPGVVLETGAAYHYLGFTFLNRNRWVEWMKNRLHAEQRRNWQKNIYDRGFIDASLTRSYSALRIFGYPGTKKEFEPKVVALVQ